MNVAAILCINPITFIHQVEQRDRIKRTSFPAAGVTSRIVHPPPSSVVFVVPVGINDNGHVGRVSTIHGLCPKTMTMIPPNGTTPPSPLGRKQLRKTGNLQVPRARRPRCHAPSCPCGGSIAAPPLSPHPSSHHSGTQPRDGLSARTNPPLGPLGLLVVLIEAPAEPRALIVRLLRYFVSS